MKKLTLLAIALGIFVISFTLNSCSKEQRFNRKIEGKWEVMEINNLYVSTNTDKAYFEFIPRKKMGTYLYTANVGSDTYSDNGYYILSEDEEITITSNMSGETLKFTILKRNMGGSKFNGMELIGGDPNGVYHMVLHKR